MKDATQVHSNKARGSLFEVATQNALSYDQINRMAAHLPLRLTMAGHVPPLVVIQADLSLPTCGLILAFLEAGIPLLVLSEHLREPTLEQVKRFIPSYQIVMWINGSDVIEGFFGDSVAITNSQELFDALQQGLDSTPLIPPLETVATSHAKTAPFSKTPDADAAAPSSDTLLTTQRDQPSLFLATSGTTGVPKWVPFSYQQLEAAAQASQAIMQPKSEHQWLLNLPLEHAGGLGILIRSYFWRSDVLISADRSAEGLLHVLQSYPRVDTISLVPTQLHRMLQRSERAVLSSLKTILIGAGTLHQNDLHLASALQLPVRLSYGMTESFGHCCITPSLIQHPLKPYQCGRPLPGIQIHIENDLGEPLPNGQVGHIRIIGNAVFKGYVGNLPTETLEIGFLTGDFGKLDNQGNLFFEARRTDLIKTGGKSVNVNRVQQAIEQIDWFTEVVVLGVEDPEWGQRVQVVGVAKKNDLQLEPLREALGSLLSPWELPRGLTFVAKIPRTPVGKTDFLALKKLLTTTPDA
jgi:acyl-CoA synthetase (AMP-forming)/AMP-acid ligase II